MYQGSDIAEPIVCQQPAQLDLRQPERSLIARRLLAEIGRGLDVAIPGVLTHAAATAGAVRRARRYLSGHD